jgi:hypothetical protein
MKRFAALFIAILIASTTLLTPVSAGVPVTPCADINGVGFAPNSHPTFGVSLKVGEQIIFQLSGATGPFEVQGATHVSGTFPGTVRFTAKSAGDYYFEFTTQQAFFVLVTCGPKSSSSSDSSDEPSSPPCASLYDGRINNDQALDCAAPIAVYLHSIDIWGINPDGSGTQLMSINADILKGPVPDSNTLLSEGTNIISGQWVRVYWLVKTAEVEVITAYPDGKPYIVVWPIAHPELLYHLAA